MLQWLCGKTARPPTWIKPQLTRLVHEAPTGSDWLHELKYDGYRMHAQVDRGRVQLLTRTGLDWSHRYRRTVGILGTLPAQTAYLDGELFIVLIYGIAGLVSVFVPGIGETNRSILILFLVLFPVAVLVVFAWLVSFHHTKLYPPQAYRDESHSVATFGGARFDKPALQSDRPKEPAPLGSLNTSATGSLYWLGHDLMWTADALLRQAPNTRRAYRVGPSAAPLGSSWTRGDSNRARSLA